MARLGFRVSSGFGTPFFRMRPERRDGIAKRMLSIIYNGPAGWGRSDLGGTDPANRWRFYFAAAVLISAVLFSPIRRGRFVSAVLICAVLFVSYDFDI